MAYGIELRNTKVFPNAINEHLNTAIIRELRWASHWLKQVITRLISTDLENIADDNVVWCLVLTVLLLVLTLA